MGGNVMNQIFEEKYILKTRVRSGVTQSELAKAFEVGCNTVSRNERYNKPLYIHAVNGYVWDKDPLAYLKTMVKAGRAPECMIKAYQEWLDSHAKNAQQGCKHNVTHSFFVDVV